MDKKRMIRNGELVDVYYNENGEEELVHWARTPRNSGRYPWPKTDISEKSAREKGELV